MKNRTLGYPRIGANNVFLKKLCLVFIRKLQIQKMFYTQCLTNHNHPLESRETHSLHGLSFFNYGHNTTYEEFKWCRIVKNWLAVQNLSSFNKLLFL